MKTAAQMKEFINLKDEYDYSSNKLKSEPPSIKTETNKDSIEAIFPDINTSLSEFELLLVWKTGANGEKFPEPFEGIDPDYDKSKLKVCEIQ